jgi:hypothetical protein
LLMGILIIGHDLVTWHAKSLSYITKMGFDSPRLQ